jgi:hypothetical protein
MMVFFINLICIARHRVPRNEPDWQRLVSLLEIADIVFASTINKGLAFYLAQLIADQNQFFLELLAHKPLSPKHQ